MEFLSSSNVGNDGFDASFLQDFLQPAEDAFSEVQQCNLQLAPFQQAQCQQQETQQQLLHLPEFPLTLANSASPSLKPSYSNINSGSKGKRGARKRKTEVCNPPSTTFCTIHLLCIRESEIILFWFLDLSLIDWCFFWFALAWYREWQRLEATGAKTFLIYSVEYVWRQSFSNEL